MFKEIFGPVGFVAAGFVVGYLMAMLVYWMTEAHRAWKIDDSVPEPLDVGD